MIRRGRSLRGHRARRKIELAEIYEWIEKINTPKGGWQRASRLDAEIAKEKISIAKKVAAKVYNLQNEDANARRRPEPVTPRQRQTIYQEGYSAARSEFYENAAELDDYRRRLDMEAVMMRREVHPTAMADPQQLERARMNGYAQGVIAGRAMAQQELAGQQVRPEEIVRIRKEMQDAMLEECRVISESNPSMSPGVNAVRHRIRKL